MATSIKYVLGDVRLPTLEGKKLIIHCCNDLGRMGSGVALALMTKWPQIRSRYIEWSKDATTFKLGNIQAVRVETNIAVINMIGQEDIITRNHIPPVRYGAIKECLSKVAQIALKHNASIHAPRFGAGLAGGSWDKIEELIKEELCNRDIDVTIYDLSEEERNKYNTNKGEQDNVEHLTT